MISARWEPLWFLAFLAVFAFVLARVGPRLVRAGLRWPVYAYAALLVAIVLGDLALGAAHTWWFNSLMLTGGLLIFATAIMVRTFRADLSPDQHGAAVALRLPMALFMVASTVLIWVTVPHP